MRIDQTYEYVNNSYLRNIYFWFLILSFPQLEI